MIKINENLSIFDGINYVHIVKTKINQQKLGVAKIQ